MAIVEYRLVAFAYKEVVESVEKWVSSLLGVSWVVIRWPRLARALTTPCGGCRGCGSGIKWDKNMYGIPRLLLDPRAERYRESDYFGREWVTDLLRLGSYHGTSVPFTPCGAAFADATVR